MQVEVERVVSAHAMQEAMAIRRVVFIEGQDVPESIEIDDYDDFPCEKDGVVHGLLRFEGEPVATGRFVPDATRRLRRKWGAWRFCLPIAVAALVGR